MRDFLHVEYLLLDLPDLPSDFKYFVNIVKICTNYLVNSLSDFSEIIIPKNIEKSISAHRNFQNFPGSMPRTPKRGRGQALAVIATRSQILGLSEFHVPP